MMRIGKTGWRRAGIVVLVGVAAFVVSAPPATTQSSTAPQHDSTVKLLLRPIGFETWVFVGSNYGLAYEETSDKPEFHNVYISPQAYAEFVKSQTFPDRTVFAIDRLTADSRDPELKAGFYNDQRKGMLAAVKNMHRPDGKTKPWAYYVFSMEGNKLQDLAAAELDSTDFKKPEEQVQTCEGCHAVHASTDHVWVQFYPILRNLLH
jgi:cytochrome P460